MAKGQTLYPAQICHFQWMGNHYHLIVAGSPKYISPFICYLQGEIAKAIMRLSGQYKNKVWAGRAKEQRIHTATDVIRMIVYIYLNPVRAGLVPQISLWPGLSSWQMYRAADKSFLAKWIPVRTIKYLPINIDAVRDMMLVKKLLKGAEGEYAFCLYPNLWKRCFSDSSNWSDTEIFEKIAKQISEQELELFKIHKGRFVGVKALKRQSIHRPYQPNNTGRSPFLICHDDQMRIELIAEYKQFCRQARDAWRRWKRGEVHANFPKGAYRPGMPLLGLIV